jgi:hypothetical protein
MIPYIGAGFSSNILANPIGNQVPNSLYKRTVAKQVDTILNML